MSRVRVQVEPVAQWPYPVTEGRSFSPFGTSYATTLDDLDRELFHLGVHRHGGAALQLVTSDGNLRRDGLLRAGARVDFPGVALSFVGDPGPLTFFCDKYVTRSAGAKGPSWHHNLRAIVSTLEKLRAVERYGATGDGRHYAGFRAIEVVSASKNSARARLAEITGLNADVTSDRDLLRKAKLLTHPDVPTGDAVAWAEVDTLSRILVGVNGS